MLLSVKNKGPFLHSRQPAKSKCVVTPNGLRFAFEITKKKKHFKINSIALGWRNHGRI